MPVAETTEITWINYADGVEETADQQKRETHSLPPHEVCES